MTKKYSKIVKFNRLDTGLITYERHTRKGVRVEIMTPAQFYQFQNRTWLTRLLNHFGL